MAKVDPKKYRKKAEKEGRSFDGPSDPFPKPAAGFISDVLENVPGVFVGLEYFRSSKKGTPGVQVRWVVPEGDHKGKVIDDSLWLSEAALPRILDIAVYNEWDEPFDPEDGEELASVLASRPIQFSTQAEYYTNSRGEEKEAVRVQWYNKFRGDLPGEDDERAEQWNDVLDVALDEWDEYLAWRKRNPRSTPDSNPKSKRGRGRGRGGYDSKSKPEVVDDDIPF